MQRIVVRHPFPVTRHGLCVGSKRLPHCTVGRSCHFIGVVVDVFWGHGQVSSTFIVLVDGLSPRTLRSFSPRDSRPQITTLHTSKTKRHPATTKNDIICVSDYSMWDHNYLFNSMMTWSTLMHSS